MKQADKILALAREQIGTAENPPGSNDVIYNTVYYGGEVHGSDYPWCCAFIWWLFQECGLSALFCGGQKTAYCPFVVQYARDNGMWRTEGYRPGDLLLYDWNGDGVADHIGICESETDEAGYLWAIEGNCGDAVQRTHRWTGSIMGAYRPRYTDGDRDDAPQDTTQATTSHSLQQTSGGPIAGEKYTVKRGDSLWGIAERAYGNGSAYPLIVTANHLTGSMIYPGQILFIPKIGGKQQESTTQDGGACTATLPVLRRGDVSMSVRILQSALTVRGYMLDVDGDYGQTTETTVKGFQASAGLDQSGIVDGATWEKIIN